MVTASVLLLPLSLYVQAFKAKLDYATCQGHTPCYCWLWLNREQKFFRNCFSVHTISAQLFHVFSFYENDFSNEIYDSQQFPNVAPLYLHAVILAVGNVIVAELLVILFSSSSFFQDGAHTAARAKQKKTSRTFLLSSNAQCSPFFLLTYILLSLDAVCDDAF